MKWLWLVVGVLLGLALAVIHKQLLAEWFPAGGSLSLETADRISQIGLFFIAVAALLYARGQVHAARDDIEQTLKLSQASFLFNLDQKWDSPEMLESRKIFRNLHSDLTALVASKYPLLDDAHKVVKLGEELVATLDQMRQQDLNNYATVMRVCGFFETVGLMVERGYIPLDEIDGMLRGPILQIKTCFGPHIRVRQNETGVPAGLYEHALQLADLVEARSPPKS